MGKVTEHVGIPGRLSFRRGAVRDFQPQPDVLEELMTFQPPGFNQSIFSACRGAELCARNETAPKALCSGVGRVVVRLLRPLAPDHLASALVGRL